MRHDTFQNEAGHQDHNIGRDIFLCFTRVVTEYQVEECSEGIEEVNAEILLEVMECGTHSVNTWVMENVSLPPPPPPLLLTDRSLLPPPPPPPQEI